MRTVEQLVQRGGSGGRTSPSVCCAERAADARPRGSRRRLAQRVRRAQRLNSGVSLFELATVELGLQQRIRADRALDGERQRIAIA